MAYKENGLWRGLTADRFGAKIDESAPLGFNTSSSYPAVQALPGLKSQHVNNPSLFLWAAAGADIIRLAFIDKQLIDL